MVRKLRVKLRTILWLQIAVQDGRLVANRRVAVVQSGDQLTGQCPHFVLGESLPVCSSGVSAINELNTR